MYLLYLPFQKNFQRARSPPLPHRHTQKRSVIIILIWESSVEMWGGGVLVVDEGGITVSLRFAAEFLYEFCQEENHADHRL